MWTSVSPWLLVVKQLSGHAPAVLRRVAGRGLHSSTFQLNQSRPGHTSLCPPD